MKHTLQSSAKSLWALECGDTYGHVKLHTHSLRHKVAIAGPSIGTYSQDRQPDQISPHQIAERPILAPLKSYYWGLVGTVRRTVKARAEIDEVITMPTYLAAQRPCRALFAALASLMLLLASCSTQSGETAGSGSTAPVDDSTSSTEDTTPRPGNTTTPDEKEEPQVLGDTEDRQSLFVAPNGNNGNSGTNESQPLRTVAEAAKRLNGIGGTINLLAGQYGGQSVSDAKGTSRRPIIIRSTGRSAILSSGRYDQGVALSIKNSENIVVDGLAAQSSLWGIRIESSNNVALIDNRITDIGQEAIHIGTSSFIDITKNEISQTGVRPGSASDGRPYSMFGEGIYVGCSCQGDTTHDIRISGNEISFTTAEAIDLKPHTYNLLVERNRIHDISTATSGAVVLGIGVRYLDDPNAVIRNNMIWNVSTTSRWTDGNAISLSAPAVVYNNVIWNMQHRGIWVDSNFVNRDARNVHIFHNTVVNTGRKGIEVKSGGNDSLATVEANIGVDLPGNLVADPSWFVDAAANDYRLAESTPPIDASIAKLVAYDAQGFPRPQGASADIGAYEFGSPALTQDVPPPVPSEAPATNQPIPQTSPPTTATSSDPTGSQAGEPPSKVPSETTGSKAPQPPLTRSGVPPKPERIPNLTDTRRGPSGESTAGLEAAPGSEASIPSSSPDRPPSDPASASGDNAGVPSTVLVDPAPEELESPSGETPRAKPDRELASGDSGPPTELAYRDVIIAPTEQLPGEPQFGSTWLLLPAIAVLLLGAWVSTRRGKHDHSA